MRVGTLLAENLHMAPLRPSPRDSSETFAIAELPPCKGGMSRRRFCAGAGAGLVTLGFAACDPGAARIVVGDGVGDEPNNNLAKGPTVDGSSSPDLSSGTNPVDAGHDAAAAPQADLAHTTNNCAGPYNAGAASAIAVGAAKYFTDNNTFELFLCRDAGGLYALSASCTHQGVTLTKQATKFHCSAHGANFDLNGEHPTSPAFSPLEHYALCVDATGNVLINYNSVVAASTRA